MCYLCEDANTKIIKKMKLHSIFKILICTAAALSAALPAAAQTTERQLTREEYVDRYKGIAVDHMERYGIPASIILAQGLLESGNGNSRLARVANNHFGIKCHTDWRGETLTHDDDAPGECFRKYDSAEESYRDHAEYLSNHRNKRYDSLFVYSSDDYVHWARGLKAAGYATAPDYAERLIRLIEENRLYLFDRDCGDSLYMASHSTGRGGAAHCGTASHDDGFDPDFHRVTVRTHRGYNVFRCNGVCFVTAKKGEKYEYIASLFRVSARNLRRYNDAGSTAQPAEGEMVYIERKRSRWEGKNLLYTVQAPGESLRDISQSHGIRLGKLARMNKMKRDAEVEQGRTVKLR